MILKQRMPWSVMGAQIHGGDLLPPLEIFHSKHIWGSFGIVGIPMYSDMRELAESAPYLSQEINLWS